MREPRLASLISYFSTKANRNGLGLAMAASIVEEHGGSIEAHSAPGSGTAMLIHLAAPPPEVCLETSRAAVAERLSVRTSGSSALAPVVDDHDTLRQVRVSILRRAGYRVIEANTGDEALRLLKSVEPAPPIAFSCR